MLYIFDVDETLAPSGQPMEEPLKNFFRTHFMGKQVFIISGGRKTRLQTQFPEDIWQNFTGIFPTLGAEFWQQENLIHQNKFVWPNGLKEELDAILAESSFPQAWRTATQVEDRGSMLCLSICGIGATAENRARYMEHDQQTQERQIIQQHLLDKFGNYMEVSIGGQTSLDLSMKGSSKAQVLPLLREKYPATPILFFGDRIEEHGNDLPLAQALQAEGSHNTIIPVQNPEDTLNKLNTLFQQKGK